MQQPLYGTYKINIENFTVPKQLKYNFAKQFMTDKIINMTQKEKLETLTGEKFPEPTPQELKRIQLENTPFWIIGNDEKGYNIILGKWKLNKEPLYREHDPLIDEWQETPERIAKNWLETNLYDIILSMIIAITTDQLNNQNKQ